MNLTNVPYKYRRGAADALISKANRLNKLGRALPKEPPLKERRALRKAIFFYDTALFLMKPYDVNYSVVMHWRCMALIRLRRYSEAVLGYEEILRIATETEAKEEKGAYAETAAREIKKYGRRKDAPYPDETEDETDVETFDDPSYTMYAHDFCELLAQGSFRKAFGKLSKSAEKKYPASKLKAEWQSMVEGADSLDIELLEYMNDWPARKRKDIGWCYFSVTNDEIQEGIAVVVASGDGNTTVIREIEFGRP